MEPAAPRAQVHRASRVITADQTGVIPDGAVVVRDGRIDWVGSAHDLADALGMPGTDPAAAPGVQIVDHGPASLLPGLVDAHVHLTLFADRRTYEEMARDTDELMVLVAVRNLRAHLDAGITTVRDNGSRNRTIFAVKEALARGYFPGPRLLAAGRPLTQTGGHFHWCNGEADGETEVARAVRRLIADGADHIKLMASGGGTVGSERDHPALTLAELEAAVTTAHALGRLTTAHCHATQAIRNAVDAGVDCIEHAEFNQGPAIRTPRGFAGPASMFGDHQDMVYDPGLVAEILQRGIAISFTPQAGGYEYLLDLRAAPDGSLTAAQRRDRDGLERKFEGRVKILSQMLADGVGANLAVSSDAGCFDGSFGKLHLGLGIAQQAGMSAADAIAACTIKAARICGVDASVGSLETGKLADLVVVDGDPTTDLSALAAPRAVYQAGVLVSGTAPTAA